MSKTTIPTGGITADAIDATLIADDAISEEHLDAIASKCSSDIASSAMSVASIASAVIPPVGIVVLLMCYSLTWFLWH